MMLNFKKFRESSPSPMMVTAATETCRNIEWLCNDFLKSLMYGGYFWKLLKNNLKDAKLFVTPMNIFLLQ